MIKPNYLSEAPIFTEYPRNEVVVRLKSGEERYLFVNNPLLPDPHGVTALIEREARAYMTQHPESVAATIYLVRSRDERIELMTLAR